MYDKDTIGMLKFRPKETIRSSVMALLCASGLFPLLVISLISMNVLKERLIEAEHEKIDMVAEYVTQKVHRHLQDLQNDATVLAQQLDFVGLPRDAGALTMLLKDVAVSAERFNRVRLYTASGLLVAGSDEEGDRELTEAEKQYLVGDQGVQMLFHPNPGRGQEQNTIHVLVRMQSNQEGQPLIAEFVTDMAAIGDAGGFEDPARKLHFMLLDSHGEVITRSGDDSEPLKFSQEMPGWHWTQYPQGRIELDGVENLYVARKIQPAQKGLGIYWTLLCHLPMDDVTAITQHAQQFHLIVVVITLTISYLLSIFLTRRLAQPFRRLARAAQKAASGDMDAKVPEEGPREVVQLSQSYNQMLKELGLHRHRMESLVVSRTEKLVASQHSLEVATAQLKASYEAAQDAILVVSLTDGKVIALNTAFKTLFGLDGDGAVPGTDDMLSIIGVRFTESKDFARRWKDLMADGDEVLKEEWTLAKPWSNTLSIYSAPVKDSGGTPFARLWMVRDLTGQRMLEEGLRQAQKMEAVGRLAGGVAHDFNNLLTSMMANLSLAISEVEEGSLARESLMSAEMSARRAADLVSKMLGFSRQSPIQVAKCDARQTLADLNQILQHSIDRRIELKIRADDDVWPFQGDGTQIEQVLMNLCVNASDAIEGKGSITVEARNVNVTQTEKDLWGDGREGEFVRISVRDTGHGIGPEARQHLFEPFFTTKELGKGTGLGLAMSYGIIQQHNGWIRFESEEGDGTTFFIYLPRCEDSVEKKPAAMADHSLKKGSAEILLVDDERAIRSVGSSMLKKFGYKVETAEDGREAIDLFMANSTRFDLIIMDLSMPRMSGREALPYLRGINPDIPIIISSGFSVELDEVMNETGVRPDAMVHKPYDMQGFISTVQQVLEARSTPVG